MSNTAPQPTGFYSSPQAFSSQSDDWATPLDFYKELSKEFNIVLDVAASSTNHKALHWYGLDHPDPARRDGMSQDWVSEAKMLGGDVWLNPPYGKTIGFWTRKAHESAAKGVTVVCLLPARTDTRWFHDTCYMHELRFVRGRLKFGNSTNSAPFPSMLVVMR